MNNRVTLDDGEIVCNNCGVVLGRSDITIHSLKYTSNLFLDTEIGSKSNKSIPSSRYIHSDKPELTIISNICRTLNIPNLISKDIWYWYNKIRANIKTTKVKILVLVFYQLCRYYKIPINESNLLLVIKTQLGVTNIHHTLDVLSEIYSFLDNAGTPIIEKIGFTKYTTHDMIFLLRCKVKTLHDEYPSEIVSKVNDVSLKLLDGISGTNEQRVKKSFDIAKQRCGIY